MKFSITSMIASVDKFGENFVTQSYQSLAQALTIGGVGGVLGLMLTLYVIFWGFGIWNGTATGGPADHAYRLLRAFAIYALATSWGDFQVYVYKFLNDTPSAVGNSLLSTVSANATGTAANLNSSNGVQNALQNIWTSVASTVTAYTKELGVLNAGGYIIALLVYGCAALMIAYAVYLIILSKIFLWILLALAPIFIVMLLYGYTSKFFNAWVTALIQYCMVQIIVYAFLAFYVSITQTTFDTLTMTNDTFATTWTQVAPVVLIALIGFLLMTQITGLAVSLTGGVPLQVLSPGKLLSPAAAAGKAVMNAGGRKFRDATNTFSRSEKLAARNSARVRLASRTFQNTPEYKALSAKLKR